MRLIALPFRAVRAVWRDVQTFRKLRAEYVAACQERQAARITIYED